MVSFVRPESLPNGKLDDICRAGAFVEPSEGIILFRGFEMDVPCDLIPDTQCWVPFSSQGTYALIHKAVDTNQRSKKRGHEEESEEQKNDKQETKAEDDGDSSKSASNRHQVNLLHS